MFSCIVSSFCCVVLCCCSCFWLRFFVTLRVFLIVSECLWHAFVVFRVLIFVVMFENPFDLWTSLIVFLQPLFCFYCVVWFSWFLIGMSLIISTNLDHGRTCLIVINIFRFKTWQPGKHEDLTRNACKLVPTQTLTMSTQFLRGDYCLNVMCLRADQKQLNTSHIFQTNQTYINNQTRSTHPQQQKHSNMIKHNQAC